MRLLVIILALSSVLLGVTSCTRGGNIDKGDNGIIGEHGRKAEENDGTYDERRHDADDGIMDDDDGIIDNGNGIVDDDNGMIPNINGRSSTDRNNGNTAGDNDGGLSGRMGRNADNNLDADGIMPEGIFPDAIRR